MATKLFPNSTYQNLFCSVLNTTSLTTTNFSSASVSSTTLIGTTLFASSISSSSINITTQVTATNITATTLTATTVTSTNITTTTLNVTGNLTIAGNITILGTLYSSSPVVSGNISVANITCSGLITTSSLYVSGNGTVAANTTVTAIYQSNATIIGSLGWIKFFTTTVTGVTGTLASMANCSGDSHCVYFIDIMGFQSSGSSQQYILLQVNGQTSGYFSQWVYAGAVYYGPTAGMMLAFKNLASVANNPFNSQSYICGSSGTPPTLTGSFTEYETTTNCYMGPLGGIYPLSNASITSMTIITSSSQTFTGTIDVYRMC